MREARSCGNCAETFLNGCSPSLRDRNVHDKLRIDCAFTQIGIDQAHGLRVCLEAASARIGRLSRAGREMRYPPCGIFCTRKASCFRCMIWTLWSLAS
jgi:hypothetical protein